MFKKNPLLRVKGFVQELKAYSTQMDKEAQGYDATIEIAQKNKEEATKESLQALKVATTLEESYN